MVCENVNVRSSGEGGKSSCGWGSISSSEKKVGVGLGEVGCRRRGVGRREREREISLALKRGKKITIMFK
jgi:hypothetical protein